MNCSAQLFLTRSTINGDGVHWETADGGCQNMRLRNVRVCHRPPPLKTIVNQEGLGMARTRAGTVPMDQFSWCIDVMHYWKAFPTARKWGWNQRGRDRPCMILQPMFACCFELYRVVGRSDYNLPSM